MGMLLRHRPEPDTLTTTECFGKPEEEKKPVEKAKESVKDEKPKTVKRGRPTK
jgi:hypothetical protein